MEIKIRAILTHPDTWTIEAIMDDGIISTWQSIANYLEIEKQACKRMAQDHKNFPIWKDGRIWTTKGSLIRWFAQKAESREE